MNEETFNMEIRKFLKKVGITSQREIENAARKAIADGRLSGMESLAVKMTLEVPLLAVKHSIEEKLDLE